MSVSSARKASPTGTAFFRPSHDAAGSRTRPWPFPKRVRCGVAGHFKEETIETARRYTLIGDTREPRNTVERVCVLRRDSRMLTGAGMERALYPDDACLSAPRAAVPEGSVPLRLRREQDMASRLA